MPEFKEHSVPIEYMRERPHVFENEAGWSLMRNFALRYGELKPEVKMRDITSGIDLIRGIENDVAQKIDEVLPKVLAAQGVSEEEQRVFFEAQRVATSQKWILRIRRRL